MVEVTLDYKAKYSTFKMNIVRERSKFPIKVEVCTDLDGFMDDWATLNDDKNSIPIVEEDGTTRNYDFTNLVEVIRKRGIWGYCFPCVSDEIFMWVDLNTVTKNQLIALISHEFAHLQIANSNPNKSSVEEHLKVGKFVDNAIASYAMGESMHNKVIEWREGNDS